ncbi:hypothetical protein CCP3SC15_3760004 [Gammaproteobacteria bacterium]
MAAPPNLTGTIVLYSMLASYFSSKTTGLEGDQAAAIIARHYIGYIAPATDAYDVWIFPPGEPPLFRATVLIGVGPGTIATIPVGPV